MKKFTFILMILLAYAGFTMAQTIEDFEIQKMNLFDAGANGALSVIANPDPTGINTSAMVCKMIRGKDGSRSAGWYGALPAVDVSVNKYVHIKVWKPRKSPVVFKFEKGTKPDTGDTYPMGSPADSSNTTINAWEELVFDFSDPKFSGSFSQIVLIPDFPSKPSLGTQLTDDITLYFDDIYVNNDPAVGSAAVRVIENYEHIPLNPFSDQGTFTLIPNPDKSGVNLSDYVIDFMRLKDAVAWTGFYSVLPTPLDVTTTNKYVHVKLWKPRLSDAKFKLEGGPKPAKEFPSMNATTEINKWQDIVFDVSEYSGGAYPTIGLLADMSGTALTEDIHMYIDDIIVNDDPNPIQPVEQKISMDMRTAPLAATDHLYITGSFGGIHGTWAEPGTNSNNEMFDTDGDGIYSIYMHLGDGVYTIKFAKNNWGGQDPLNKDRPLTITGNANVIFTWGTDGFITSIRDNKLADKIQMYPNPVRNQLTINSTSDISKVIITNTVGKVVRNLNYSSNETISTSDLSRGMYFVTFISRDGNKVTQKLIKD